MYTMNPEEFDVMKNKTLEQSKSEQNQITTSFKLRNGQCPASVHPIWDAAGSWESKSSRSSRNLNSNVGFLLAIKNS